jgi:hypothetical protein
MTEPAFDYDSAADTELLRDFRQGEIVPLQRIPWLVAAGEIREFNTPNGVVLLSQTCDLVLPGRSTVQVSPLVELSGTVATEAALFRRPQYGPVPGAGPNSYADFSMVATVGKELIAAHLPRHGLLSIEQQRSFARAAGRRLSRFPFPDEVTPWLRPLQKIAQSKHGRLESPEGRAFRELIEIRVESANGWSEPPFDLTLAFIVRPGALPTLTDDILPDMPAALRRWLLARVRVSEALDLDHLSSPTPLDGRT